MQIIRAYSERGQTPMNITHTILATVGSIIVVGLPVSRLAEELHDFLKKVQSK